MKDEETVLFKSEVSRGNFYFKYYTALNGVLNLSKKQLEVLAALSTIRNSLDNSTNFTEEQKDILTFSTKSRNIVTEKLEISNYNLNNLLKVLRDKKIILNHPTDNRYFLNPSVYSPLRKEGRNLTFKFIIK